MMAVIWVFQFATAYAFRGYYDFDKYERKSEYWGVSQRNYPDKAVEFLVQNKVRGNFLNDFNSGAYLLGHVYPNIKVFIDGRTEVYGAKFFNDYREIFMRGNKDVLIQSLENYKITGVLLNSSSQPIEGSLLKFFYEHKDWSLVYFDYDGAVFLKNVELNQSVIAQHKIDLKNAEVQKLDLFKLGPIDVLPYRNYYRAYSLESMDLNALALAEAFEALKINPQYSSVYDLIGKIYAKQKDYQKAFDHFRLAVMYDPDKKENLYNFAMAYFDLGQYEGAIKRYKGICSRFPQEPKAYFFLAKSYMKNHEYVQGVQTLKDILSLKPLKADDFFALVELLVEEKQYLYALDVCRMPAILNMDSEMINKKLGEVLKAAKEDKVWQQKYCQETMLSQEKDERAWLIDHCVYEEANSSRDSH
jgi:tetratricopeptide (TPR) repeat protein